MRRTMLSLIGSMISVVLLIGLKAAPTASLLGWSAESELGPDGLAAGDGTDVGAGAPPAGPGGAGSGGAGPSVSPGASAGPSASRSPGATPGPPAPGASTTTNTAPAPSKTYTGVAVAVKTAQSPNTKTSSCGDCAAYSISVTITVSGGRITATSVAYSPTPGGDSLNLAKQANTQLSSSILKAQTQTWKLGAVSGATYSGNAWDLSVKDAMIKAGLPV